MTRIVRSIFLRCRCFPVWIALGWLHRVDTYRLILHLFLDLAILPSLALLTIRRRFALLLLIKWWMGFCGTGVKDTLAFIFVLRGRLRGPERAELLLFVVWIGLFSFALFLLVGAATVVLADETWIGREFHRILRHDSTDFGRFFSAGVRDEGVMLHVSVLVYLVLWESLLALDRFWHSQWAATLVNVNLWWYAIIHCERILLIETSLSTIFLIECRILICTASRRVTSHLLIRASITI